MQLERFRPRYFCQQHTQGKLPCVINMKSSTETNSTGVRTDIETKGPRPQGLNIKSSEENGSRLSLRFTYDHSLLLHLSFPDISLSIMNDGPRRRGSLVSQLFSRRHRHRWMGRSDLLPASNASPTPELAEQTFNAQKPIGW